MPLLPGIIEALFNLEVNDLRFEEFCRELYSKVGDVVLVPTSRTWDLGRDGRTISTRGGDGRLAAVLCATLSERVDQKVEADVRRLKQTTQTGRIVYCSSRAISETRCDKIQAEIRKLYPSAESVVVLGQIQLVDLARDNEQILRHHYAAEIQNAEQALAFEPTTSRDPENLALRLALVTQTGDNARELRSELAKRLILDTLYSRGSETPGSLAVSISGELHLSRSISAAYVSEILFQLKHECLVAFEDDRISITPAGTEFVQTIPAAASTRLLEGRSAVREAIKMLSGHDLNDSQYEHVWNTLQDGLAALFYSHGAAIVRMLGSLLTGERAKPEASENVLLERLGDQIMPLFTDPSQGEEVRQAVIDMFSAKDSDAFKWLSQICSVYVMLCSLGFESLSNQEVTRILRGFYFVADSDVVLSLLCKGEENHQEVSRIVDGWRLLGGKILMATPILEEVAYHAWISERDYNSTRQLFEHISDSQAKHLIGNAFVRTFRLLAKGKMDRKYWQSYISTYRGQTDRDYGLLMEILRDEHGFELLPDADQRYDQFAEQVAEFLGQRASRDAKCDPEDLDPRTKDKCRRDAILVSSLRASRDTTRQSGVRGTTIILSSARLIKEADEVFRKELGQPDGVVSTAALGWLLTLAPGVQMGLGTLRGILFDLGMAMRFSPVQRYAYRLIAASGEFDLPWSRRVSLQRELAGRLLADARATGQPVKNIRERLLKSEDPEYSAKIVADALNKIAGVPEIQKRAWKLQEEVERLTEELQEQKSRGYNPPATQRVSHKRRRNKK